MDKIDEVNGKSSLNEYLIYISVSTDFAPLPFSPSRYAYAWSIYSSDGMFIWHGSDRLRGGVEGDQTKGLFPAFFEAIAKVPDQSSATIIANEEYFLQHLKGGRIERCSRNYRKSNGQPYADADALRKMDQLISVREISITARRPGSEVERRALASAKTIAHENAKNIDCGPGEWGT